MATNTEKGIAAGIAVLFIVIVVVPFNVLKHGNRDTVTAVVNSTERVATSDGETVSSQYLIFTDAGTFACHDSWWEGKWNSSDIYGGIKEGRMYTFEVYGWRIPFLSMYKNVVSATEAQYPEYPDQPKER